MLMWLYFQQWRRLAPRAIEVTLNALDFTLNIAKIYSMSNVCTIMWQEVPACRVLEYMINLIGGVNVFGVIWHACTNLRYCRTHVYYRMTSDSSGSNYLFPRHYFYLRHRLHGRSHSLGAEVYCLWTSIIWTFKTVRILPYCFGYKWSLVLLYHFLDR